MHCSCCPSSVDWQTDGHDTQPHGSVPCEIVGVLGAIADAGIQVTLSLYP